MFSKTRCFSILYFSPGCSCQQTRVQREKEKV